MADVSVPDYINLVGDTGGHEFVRQANPVGIVADTVAKCRRCRIDGETFLATRQECPGHVVHFTQNGGALHAVVDVTDFHGSQEPAQVTCETCRAIMATQDGVNDTLENAAVAMGEPAPPDDLESLSLAEHLGILVASHVTALEQQRDQARMWATTLEGQLAEATDHLEALIGVLREVGTTFAQDTRILERANEFRRALESPSDTQDPEGDL